MSESTKWLSRKIGKGEQNKSKEIRTGQYEDKVQINTAGNNNQ